MRSAPAVVMALASFAFLACSDNRPGGSGQPKPRADSGNSAGGGAGGDTGSSTTADAAPEADTGVAIDTGAADTGVSRDTGSGLGPVCMELELCCNEVPAQGQQTCFNTAAGGDEARCQQGLDLARNTFGVCIPPGQDAAMPRDGGPLGPSCLAYLACCPELGPLQGRCVMTAMGGDEATCMMNLARAQQFGRCMGMPDSGVGDTGAGDLGVSDTGTSTGADAAEPDAAIADADTSTATDAR